ATSGAPHGTANCGEREAGGHVGGHPYGGLSPIYSMGHRHKWQNKRLGANPARTNACPSRHKQLIPLCESHDSPLSK
ncbi:unnamed protein product, partial [Tetraodon nigroviridis]